MCGRYTLRNAPAGTTHTPWVDYSGDIALFVPRFNIAPSESAPVIVHHQGVNGCRLMPWGFKPAWSRYSPAINARAETLLTSNMFKGSARHQRCLVIADGFYEPKGPKSRHSRPWYFFHYEDDAPFAMAGIWTQDNGFAIVTAPANEQIAAIHERMPLILSTEDWQNWLDPGIQTDHDIAPMLAPTCHTGLRHHPVTNFVKKAGNEGPLCIAMLSPE